MNHEENFRLAYIDYIKIISVFAVIVLHAVGYHVIAVNSGVSWYLANFYSLLTRFAIPCFLMCSGGGHLGKSFTSWPDVKRFYVKYIPKYFGYIVFCHLIYKYFEIKSHLDAKLEINFFRGLFYDLHSTTGLSWYLFLLLGCIIATPLFSLIVKQRWSLYLFLFIWFMTVVNGNIKQLININFYINDLLIANYFVGYYVMGYALNNIKIKFKTRPVFFTILITVILMNAITAFVAQKNGILNESLYLGGNVLIAIYSILMFLLLKNIFFNFKVNAFITLLSSRVIYIYIFHLVILGFMGGFDISASATVRTFILCPITFMVCFGLSLIAHPIVAIIGKFLWKILSENIFTSWIRKKIRQGAMSLRATFMWE
jgi:surface polysaccharide O-acyltransferase-like enzyme